MIQSFEIPGRLDGLNEYTAACRRDKHAGGKMKRHNQTIVEWAIKASRLKAMRTPIKARFVWIEPNAKRDKDNVAFAKKFILDALVEMGIIASDGWKHIDGFTDEFLVNRSNPRIIVYLEEV